jgi:hypothetical protein
MSQKTVQTQFRNKQNTIKSSVVVAAKKNGANTVPSPSVKPRNGGRRRNRNRGKQNVSTSLNTAKNNSNYNILLTSAPTDPLTLNSNVQSVTGVSLGIISYALQRNFAAITPDPNFPYHAFVYIATMLQSAMSSASPKSQKVPMFLKDLMDAISPCHVKFANGFQAYNWDLDFDAAAAPYTYDLRPTGLPRNWNIGVVSTSVVNNLWHTINPPTAYTEADGVKAWTSLLEFYEGLQVDQSQLRIVDAGGPGRYISDVSAFAAVGKTLGNSGTDIGGFGAVASSEVPIRNPLFSCFAKIPSGQITDPGRFPAYNITKSLDSIALGGIMCSGYAPKLIGSKLYPVLKNVDFMRFVEVIALWLTGAARLAAGSAEDKGYLDIDASTYTLQMTLQEFELLLRNLMMNAFGNTQFFIQGCYPTDNFNNSNPFLPFVSGQGTYPVNEGTDMRLPQFLIENIRSLTSVVQKGNNPVCFLPVLGKYAKVELNWKDYYYLIPGSEVPQYIFFDPTTAVKERGVVIKGKMETAYSAETVISLVDGSTGSSYVAINAPFAMTTLSEKWNQLMDKISPFVNTLTTLGNDAGISVLRMLTNTQVHFMNVEKHPSLPANRKVVDRDLPDRFEKRFGSDVLTSTSPYQKVMLHAWNFYDPPMAQPFQLIQNIWISSDFQLWFSGTNNEIVTEVKIISYAREPNVMTYTGGDDQTTFYLKHLNYANMMLRARNGEVSMQDTLLKELEKQGRGGILSSLVGGLIKTIAPGSAKIVDTVSGFIPFNVPNPQMKK